MWREHGIGLFKIGNFEQPTGCSTWTTCLRIEELSNMAPVMCPLPFLFSSPMKYIYHITKLSYVASAIKVFLFPFMTIFFKLAA